MTFVLSDESLNTYNFWVKTSGIDLSQFRKNPVMYFMHIRPGESVFNENTSQKLLPIGVWENIRIEGDQLLADPKFDESDDFAVKIKQKVEGGFLRMASLGFTPLVMSEEKKDMKPGQKRQTVLKCMALEGSIVDRGANPNALKLYSTEGQVVNLSDGLDSYVPLISINTDMKFSNDFLKTLGLSGNPEQQEVENAVASIVQKKQDGESELAALRAENETLKAGLKTLRQGQLDKALNDPKKKLSDEQKQNFRSLAEKDFDLALKTVSLMPDYQSLKDVPVDGGQGEVIPGDRKGWSFSDWQEKDGKGLLALRDDYPEKYTELYKKQFNREPKL